MLAHPHVSTSVYICWTESPDYLRLSTTTYLPRPLRNEKCVSCDTRSSTGSENAKKRKSLPPFPTDCQERRTADGTGTVSSPERSKIGTKATSNR